MSQARLRWQCRRGMLELDELLLAFVEQDYESLGEQQRDAFEALLRESDLDLHAWLISKEKPVPAPYSALACAMGSLDCGKSTSW